MGPSDSGNLCTVTHPRTKPKSTSIYNRYKGVVGNKEAKYSYISLL